LATVMLGFLGAAGLVSATVSLPTDFFFCSSSSGLDPTGIKLRVPGTVFKSEEGPLKERRLLCCIPNPTGCWRNIAHAVVLLVASDRAGVFKTRRKPRMDELLILPKSANRLSEFAGLATDARQGKGLLPSGPSPHFVEFLR
jgi:hypothetical protein